MLVKDEADIIEPVLDHLSRNVDAMIVCDNGSTDGTRELLDSWQRLSDQLLVLDDFGVAYYQSRKMTQLARMASERGHAWVVPVDADEVWYAPGSRVADLLAAQGPDVQIMRAALYNHLPTARDPVHRNPLRRLGWRQRAPGALPKVAARLHPTLTIEAGNHGAHYDGPHVATDGLVIRHFSWRSPEQYLRKIRNGCVAYAETNLPEAIGAHWRMLAGHSDEEIMAHYDRWFFVPEPEADPALIYDPAPIEP